MGKLEDCIVPLFLFGSFVITVGYIFSEYDKREKLEARYKLAHSKTLATYADTNFDNKISKEEADTFMAHLYLEKQVSIVDGQPVFKSNGEKVPLKTIVDYLENYTP